MNANQVTALRELLSSTDWMGQTRRFARVLHSSAKDDLLLFGTPEEEPWHLAAHLDDESRYVPALKPTLVRWAPPPGAPPHLAVGLDRLREARKGEALFVVAEETAPPHLLERVDDARRTGAIILTMGGGDRELEGLAHEALVVQPSGLVTFDAAQHLVSAAAGDLSRNSLKDRLARFLDLVTGPALPDLLSPACPRSRCVLWHARSPFWPRPRWRTAPSGPCPGSPDRAPPSCA